MAHPWFSSINWNQIYDKTHVAPYIPQLDNEHCTKHFAQDFLQMKLTPQDVASLKDNNMTFENFTYEEQNLGNDDGTNF